MLGINHARKSSFLQREKNQMAVSGNKNSLQSGPIVVSFLVLSLGIGWIVYALQIDATVYAMGSSYYNVGLMAEKQSQLLIGCLISLVGAIGLIYSLNKGSNTNSSEKSSKFEKPLGDNSLDSSQYKYWLIKEYDINKNDLLNRYFCGESDFETLEHALEYAYRLEEEEVKRKAKERILTEQRKEKTQKLAVIIGAVVILLSGMAFAYGKYSDHREMVDNEERQKANEARLKTERMEAVRKMWAERNKK